MFDLEDGERETERFHLPKAVGLAARRPLHLWWQIGGRLRPRGFPARPCGPLGAGSVG